MALRTTAIAVVITVLLFGFGNGLKCRSGFETSFYNIPIAFIGNSQCSSGTEQSCFAHELNYTAFGQELSLVFGSCVSTEYQSYLECSQLFGPNGLEIDRLLVIVPSIEEELQSAVSDFSTTFAQNIEGFFQNLNDGINEVEIIYNVLSSAMISVPDSVRPTLKKVDALMLTLVVNQSELSTAVNGLLDSFSAIMTPDPAASKLLFDFFGRLNITVPGQFEPMINNLPGFVAQFVDGDQTYEALNATLYQIISAFDLSEPVDSLQVIINTLKASLPAELNQVHPLLDTIPNLFTELMQGNFDYISTWQLKLLKAFSIVTPATEALSNSTMALIRRLGYGDSLTEDIETFIRYQPGQLYMYFSADDAAQINYVFFNISRILDSIDASAQLDLDSLLGQFAVEPDFPGREKLVPLVEGFIKVAVAGDELAMAKYALEALKNVSEVTTESKQLSDSIVTFAVKLNVSLPAEIQEMVTYLPSLLYSAFPMNTSLISMIFLNISQGLDAVDINNPFAMLNANIQQQLSSLGDLLPPELNTALAQLPGLFTALQTEDMNNVSAWMTETAQKLNLPESDASNGLTNALRKFVSEIGLPVDPLLDQLAGYFIRAPYLAFPANASIIDMLYNNITNTLMHFNTSNPEAISDIFQTIDFSMLPSELLPLINSTRTLLQSIMRNETWLDALMKFASTIPPHYCSSNVLTQAFSNAVFQDLTSTGIRLTEEFKPLLECIPAFAYLAFPEDTAVITTVFTNITTAFTNYTAYVIQTLQQVGFNPPPQLLKFLEKWPAIEMALLEGNFTKVGILLQEYSSETAYDTQLSKLITTILTKLGIDVTAEIEMSIRQSVAGFYNDQLANYTEMFDIIFSSLNEDIAADVNLGAAIKNAFSKAGIAIPDRAIPVIDGSQDLLQALMSGEPNTINNAILSILEAYDASFPSNQTQLAIYQLKLQIALTNVTNIVLDDVFVYAENIYKLMLAQVGLTENDLKNGLLQVFPGMEAGIDILFMLDPKEVFDLGTKFVTWAMDPNRNFAVLAAEINSTIHILFDRYNINARYLLETLVEPNTCRFSVCQDSDSCNIPAILKDVMVVTPPTSLTSQAAVTLRPTIAKTEAQDTTTAGFTTPTPTTIETTEYTTIATTSGGMHVVRSAALVATFSGLLCFFSIHSL